MLIQHIGENKSDFEFEEVSRAIETIRSSALFTSLDDVARVKARAFLILNFTVWFALT